jgi:hypothetical protein
MYSIYEVHNHTHWVSDAIFLTLYAFHTKDCMPCVKDPAPLISTEFYGRTGKHVFSIGVDSLTFSKSFRKVIGVVKWLWLDPAYPYNILNVNNSIFQPPPAP